MPNIKYLLNAYLHETSLKYDTPMLVKLYR